MAAASELVERFLANYASARTREEYTRDLGQWVKWTAAEGIDLVHPPAGAVTKWIGHLRDRGMKESTVLRKVATLGAFYKWARHDGVTTADPMPFRRPKLHVDDCTRLGLDKEDAQRVLAATRPGRERALVALLLCCALRISEALGADVPSLRTIEGQRVLHVMGKGKRPRTVVVDPPVAATLDSYIGDRETGPIFVTRTGARMTRQEAWATVRRLGRRAGVPIHPHLFRHTSVTQMLREGQPLDKVQVAAGHADPKTTMRYAKARDQLDSSALHSLTSLLEGLPPARG